MDFEFNLFFRLHFLLFFCLLKFNSTQSTTKKKNIVNLELEILFIFPLTKYKEMESNIWRNILFKKFVFFTFKN